ncbi:methylmalonyl-CoA mutase subunit beta [Flavobacteriaceae bacterium M23B6Z8]
MNKPLFDMFSEVSAKQWKQKIQFDLKGADYNNTLITRTNEGIDIKPFYHGDEVDSMPSLTREDTWKVAQRITVISETEANKKALQAIQGGVDAIDFLITNEEVDVKALLEQIDLDKTIVYFTPSFLNLTFIEKLNARFSGAKQKAFCFVDIIHHLAATGNWYENLEKDHEKLKTAIASDFDNVALLSIDATLYQNAGAHAVQQLAYAIAHANEYFNFFEHQGLVAGFSKKTLVFRMAMGHDYFMEIAKLRALRILFKTLADAYGLDIKCHILAEPSRRNKTIYDYNTNLLRTTTECMSAVLGGADAICNLPYDALYHHANDFGDRISKNQLLILKHESYFDKVDNPVDGTYYVEELTRQLSEKALAVFKQIEEGGGFINQLKEHNIQRKIKESAAQEQASFDAGERVLVGTNKYQNSQDRMKEELEVSPFREKKSRKTILEPILEKRLAETTEKQRLENEDK